MTDQAGEPGVSSEETISLGTSIKNERKQIHHRVTLLVRRILELIEKPKVEGNKRRLKKEIKQLQKDLDVARDLHRQLLEFVDNNDRLALLNH